MVPYRSRRIWIKGPLCRSPVVSIASSPINPECIQPPLPLLPNLSHINNAHKPRPCATPPIAHPSAATAVGVAPILLHAHSDDHRLLCITSIRVYHTSESIPLSIVPFLVASYAFAMLATI